MAASITSAEQLITENIDVWTSAIKKRGSQGRGSNKKIELYGIKKLRELILELAVRGLLVPQDPNNEPASVLLEKIAAEKEQLIKDGKIKKQKALPEISEDEKPFVLSNGWEFVQLGDICDLNGGFAFKSSNYTAEGARVIRISDFDERGFKDERIVRHEYTNDLEQYVLEENNILMAMTGGTVGKCLLVKNIDEKMVVNQRVATMRFFSEVIPSYMKIALQTSTVKKVIKEAKNSTNDNISMSNIKGFIIATPPETEVKRIVAKVDELMALCDQLEQQTESSLSAHQTLVEILLNTLLNADQNSFDQAWERIAQHFDVLFATEHSIDQLKQTILQLAVMGKLVPQDQNDEPASALLEKIAAEKEQLIKDKVIKKQKPLPPISEDEKSFELPKGWEWSRLGESLEVISDYHSNGAYKKLKENVELLDEKDFAIMLRTTNFSDKNYSNYKYITKKAYEFLSKSKLFPGDIVVNKIGDPGAAFFVEDRGGPMSLAMNLFLLRTLKVEGKYVYLYLNAMAEYVRSFSAGTSTQTITKDAVNCLVLPLPPISEQSRIVAKVDELMSLCDTLTSRISESQTTQLHLADAMAEQALS